MVRKRVVIICVFVVLAALVVWQVWREYNSQALITKILTQHGGFSDRVSWFKILRERRTPLVDQFMIDVARDPFICFRPGYRELARQPEGITNAERRFVATFAALAVESFPERSGREIFEVLVQNLSVETYGRYSKNTFFIRAQCGTKPVRECARQKLVAITGEDFEYDIEKWKTFIREKYGFELETTGAAGVATSIDA